jgi:hypothetical protein
MFVLKYYRPFDQFQQTRGGTARAGTARIVAGIDAHGWKPHLIAFRDLIFRAHALTIHAYLALAQQPINAAPRHGFEVAHEKVIDSLARFVGGYGAHLHRTFWSVQADGFG